MCSISAHLCFFFFFFNDPATTEIYTLSLHDALPISSHSRRRRSSRRRPGSAWPGTQTQVFSEDRKSTRLNSSHVSISYAVFCLKKKKKRIPTTQSTSPTTNKH